MPRPHTTTVLVTLVLTLSACQSSAPAAVSLAGSQWVLTALHGAALAKGTHITLAFEDLAHFSEWIKVLGTYPAHTFRAQQNGVDES